ncbi:hypothetical protein J2128_000554 [Methanomicrobium sp. W14]|uniref:hypothetical protein n=1 Tax=Methanomicrobium sp. W14 TaxID=2817839 RepID=UPI001AE492B1|nr:hypothetical protein [Methanomicrobium sp. W14]MBP2132633.1 hypothetical protein [Methanomicrobium sp. W14]
MSGDLFAILLSLVIIYSVVYLAIKSARFMMHILKKIVLLVIILIAVYIFLNNFLFRIVTYGFTPDVVVVGFTGLACGIFALVVAVVKVRAALKSRKKEHPGEVAAGAGLKGGDNVSAVQVSEENNILSSPYIPSQLSNFAKDNSVGMVIIYLIVAEFGIFSSKTIAAVSVDSGFAVFVIFMVAALIFVRLTYNDYKKGLAHLAVAFVFGFILSVLLGYFWGGTPMDVLLSKQYFATDALVALITGLSLSLFMSKKG